MIVRFKTLRRAAVDSTMYSTTSMLRTFELILGLQPMTQFDLPLNEIIWRSVRGAGQPMPAPVSAAHVVEHPED